jgi:ubiquinone/menaquinone biosynthesis C-methylase UbiE
MEVLEHVENPWKGVKESFRILKKEGLIIGSTPFIFPIHDEPYEFYRYTKYGLKKMFSKFSSFKVKERNSYFESIYVLILRAYFNKNKIEKKFFLFIFPLIILSLIPVYILSKLFQMKNATTGYFFISKK